MSEKINLFTSYFQCGNQQRQRELDFCLEKNKANHLIHKIYLFSERPTYKIFFEQTRKYPDYINILTNADIYFNETLDYVRFIKPNQCFALTRWEDYEKKIVSFETRHIENKEAKAKHSQDVWIFRGAVKAEVYGNFYLGIPGCDNRIAFEIGRMYSVINPSKTIQSIHKHRNPVRKYNIPEGSPDRIMGRYKWVDPCAISTEGDIVYNHTIHYRGAV